MEWFLKKRRYNKGRSIPFDVVISTESNPALMSVMYNARLAAHANYMTLRECLAVTNNGINDCNFASVTNFDEFLYFMNVTLLNRRNYETCFRSINSIKFPSSLKEIKGYFLYNFSSSANVNYDILEIDTNNVESIEAANGSRGFIDATDDTDALHIHKLIIRSAFKSLYNFNRSTYKNPIIDIVEIESLNSWLNVNLSIGGYSGLGITNKTTILVEGNPLVNLTIPNTFTEIKNYSFRSFSDLTTLTIPRQITNIGKESFKNCTALTNITIGDNNNNLAPITFNIDAFAGCITLNNFYFKMQDRLNSTYQNAQANPLYYCKYLYCEGFNSGYIATYENGGFQLWEPNTRRFPITSIPAYCFVNLIIERLCISIYDTDGTKTNLSIGNSAFENSTILMLTTGNANHFNSNNVNDENIISVGNSAFKNCTNLEKFYKTTFINTTFNDNCFYNCQNLEIDIVDSTKVAYRSFYNCYKIKSVVLVTNCNLRTQCFQNAQIESLETNNITTNYTSNWSSSYELPLENATIIKWVINTGTINGCISLGTFRTGNYIITNAKATVKKLDLNGVLTMSNPKNEIALNNNNLLIIQSTASVTGGTLSITFAQGSYIVSKYTDGTNAFNNITLSNKSTCTLYVPEGATNYDNNTLGFSSIVEVGTNNPVTIDGTTYTDIDDLATALWEDTSLD